MNKLLHTILLMLAALPLMAYEVIVFGDVHFDTDTVRDPQRERPQYQINETRRNLAAWQVRKEMPALLDRAALKVTPETALVVQLGDIVQGDFGSKKRHKQALDLVLKEFHQRFTAVPFVMVSGNHDYRGPGAKSAYSEKITEYLNRTLHLSLAPKPPVQYVWTKERDLWVMLDYGHPDPAFLERAVAAHPDLRHLFVLLHSAILPNRYTADVYWKDMDDATRRKFISVLAKHHAIVLSAHIHHTKLVRWKNSEGSITQVSCFSIFPEKPEPASAINRDLKNPFPPFSPGKDKKVAARKKMIDKEFLPGITQMQDFHPEAGFSILKSDNKGVTLEIYNTKKPTPTFQLKLK